MGFFNLFLIVFVFDDFVDYSFGMFLVLMDDFKHIPFWHFIFKLIIWPGFSLELIVGIFLQFILGLKVGVVIDKQNQNNDSAQQCDDKWY